MLLLHALLLSCLICWSYAALPLLCHIKTALRVLDATTPEQG